MSTSTSLTTTSAGSMFSLASVGVSKQSISSNSPSPTAVSSSMDSLPALVSTAGMLSTQSTGSIAGNKVVTPRASALSDQILLLSNDKQFAIRKLNFDEVQVSEEAAVVTCASASAPPPPPITAPKSKTVKEDKFDSCLSRLVMPEWSKLCDPTGLAHVRAMAASEEDIQAGAIRHWKKCQSEIIKNISRRTNPRTCYEYDEDNKKVLSVLRDQREKWKAQINALGALDILECSSELLSIMNSAQDEVASIDKQLMEKSILMTGSELKSRWEKDYSDEELLLMLNTYIELEPEKKAYYHQNNEEYFGNNSYCITDADDYDHLKKFYAPQIKQAAKLAAEIDFPSLYAGEAANKTLFLSHMKKEYVANKDGWFDVLSSQAIGISLDGSDSPIKEHNLELLLEVIHARRTPINLATKIPLYNPLEG